MWQPLTGGRDFGDRAHIAKMAHQYPNFSVVGQGDNWSVQAEWPDGTIETAATSFKSEADAFNWLNHHSEAWLTKRRG
jgi:hypothetical protein